MTANLASDELIVEEDGDIATITLNVPKSMNPLSARMRERLHDVLASLTEQAACRCIVIKGAGENFSSGGDISEMRWRSLAEGRARLERTHRLIRLLAAGPKPVIAAIEGNAFGGGLSLALACDYIVAAENAKLGASFVSRVGLLPDMGMMWTLSQRVGLGRSKQMMALGTVIGGQQAVEIGMVDQVVAPGTAAQAARTMARKFADLPPMAVAMLKTSMATRVTSLEGALQAEVDYQSVLFQSADHAEATSAFMEKRRPKFTGESGK